MVCRPHRAGAQSVCANRACRVEDTRKLIDKLHEDHRPATDPSIVSAPTPGSSLGWTTTRWCASHKTRTASSNSGYPWASSCQLAPLSLRFANRLRRLDADAALRSIEMGPERTLDQNMAYGLRLLVDIGERSLSDGPFQDPTTAVQAIDRLHDCLRQLATRPFPDGRFRDSAGEIRLIAPSMTWEDCVHLAFDEIRMAGSGSPQIARRLRAAL